MTMTRLAKTATSTTWSIDKKFAAIATREPQVQTL